MKHKSKSPPKRKIAKKSKFRKNEAVSSKVFDCDHMANLLRLTDEFGNFGDQIDGPEIWPVQNWGGWGVGLGGGGVALPPTPISNM